MARYTAENEIPAGCEGHCFVGWDSLDGRSTEATMASGLNLLMGRAMKAEFKTMQPGERRVFAHGRNLFREF